MNLLDRLIASVAPRAAYSRAVARSNMAALEAARMEYEAARPGRRTEHWRIGAGDANAETRRATSRLRAVSRDMVRNVPYAGRGVSVIANNMIGGGVIPSTVAEDDARKKEIEALLKAHCDTRAIDAAGQMSLYGLQRLIVRTVVEAGECLVRARFRRMSDGLPVPLQLQVLEPDFLDSTKDGEVDGGFVVQGVEFDFLGRRTAYWLFDRHPGDQTLRRRLQSRRVPARFVSHIYRIDRPGQVRGVTWFAPVATRLADLHDFSDAQLLRQKIAACFAAFITVEDDAATLASATKANPDAASPYRVETLEPGTIERLKIGEKVEFGVPPLVGDFDPYTRAILREIAAGLGISYEALTGDLSNVNFSSARMGWLEFQRNIKSWLEEMVITQFGGDFARWFTEAAAVVAPGKPFNLVWTPPRREMIDPGKEISAAREAVRAGFRSRSEVIRQDGFDPEDVDAEMAADLARAASLGLVFTSDGRNAVNGGNGDGGQQNSSQGDAQNAA